MPKVYLAGPISGLTFDEAQDWRHAFAAAMPLAIECYSPLRVKQFLRAHGVLEQSYPHHPLSTDRGIMTRDHNDVRTADALVANLAGAPRVSIGTVMEIAWAHAYSVPVIAILDTQHDHPMIREAVGFRVRTLDEAAAVVEALLLP